MSKFIGFAFGYSLKYPDPFFFWYLNNESDTDIAGFWYRIHGSNTFQESGRIKSRPFSYPIKPECAPVTDTSWTETIFIDPDSLSVPTQGPSQSLIKPRLGSRDRD